MSKLTEWFKGLTVPVQVVLLVGIFALIAMALWLARDLSWLPGWLSS